MQDCKECIDSRRLCGSQSAVAYLTQVEPAHSLSPQLPKLRPITLVNHTSIRLAYANKFVERPSSEEELAIINGHPAEKRKWSQVTRCGSCSDDSCSSDDEVRDLLSASPKPLTFSAAPPRGIRRMTQTMPPNVFLSRMSPSVQICSVSPRKRHRQTYGSDVSEATVMQRPCLDFEKMQVSRSCVLPVQRHTFVWCTFYVGETLNFVEQVCCKCALVYYLLQLIKQNLKSGNLATGILKTCN